MVLALAAHSGVRLAEIAYLLIVFAGTWLVASEIPRFKIRKSRRIVTGAALAAAGLLLFVATHWGHFS